MEKSRIKALFDSDTYLKVLSVIIALVLWSYVSFVLDPETNKEITNIPVKFMNEQVLANEDLTLVNSDYKVAIEVKGRRNIINSLNKDKVYAEAELSGINKIGQHTITLKLRGIPSSLEIIKEPDDIVIEIDKLLLTERPINVLVKGEPQAGYALFNPVVNPSTVKIKGSQKLIDSIYGVMVNIDVTNQSSNLTLKQPINIIDNKGNVISGLKAGIDAVEVSAPIVKAKEVSVKPAFKGIVSKDANIQNVTINPQKVLITGNENLIKDITELDLKQVDLRGATSTITTKTGIELPSGVSLIKSDQLIDITVEITKDSIVSVNIDNIQVFDKNPGFDYKFLKEKIDVRISGDDTSIKSLNNQVIYANTSVKGIKEGDYTISVALNLPSSIKQNTAKIPIRITKKN